METLQQENYTVPGMPPLKRQSRTVSFFEYWPTWVFYVPVVFQWIALSIRHRSLSLPLIANPSIPLSGMIGYSKSDVLDAAGPIAQENILPFITHRADGSGEVELSDIYQRLEERGLALPLVGKPDMGCRGAGVQLLKSDTDLKTYLNSFPEGGTFMLQKLSNWEPEVGISYVREPDLKQGVVISLALKYSPYVVGDGRHTLAELLGDDERAGPLKHLYAERHQSMMDQVIPMNEPFRLVFAANHCRGAIHRDGHEYITEALLKKLDEIFHDIPNFHYGRLDAKFKDIESLTQGETMEIVEINCANSEPLHIWDSDTKLSKALKALLQQYGMLFKIGSQNRKRGHRPPGLTALWKAWQRERKLVAQYPETD
mmetsp:Transcript_13105/g.15396  ORF Transcript_13105/g.15396 Transcript_13105/m.15396 type:complete len:371 (-) Transcript_13105:281-1393(-)